MVAIAGRVMFTLIFFLSGITHFTDVQSYAELMPPAIPFRPFWVMTSGAVELFGAGLILTNRMAELGGWLIFIGGWLLLNEMRVLRFRDSWPLVLVALGVHTIWKAVVRRTPPNAPQTRQGS